MRLVTFPRLLHLAVCIWSLWTNVSIHTSNFWTPRNFNLFTAHCNTWWLYDTSRDVHSGTANNHDANVYIIYIYSNIFKCKLWLLPHKETTDVCACAKMQTTLLSAGCQHNLLDGSCHWLVKKACGKLSSSLLPWSNAEYALCNKSVCHARSPAVRQASLPSPLSCCGHLTHKKKSLLQKLWKPTCSGKSLDEVGISLI